MIHRAHILLVTYLRRWGSHAGFVICQCGTGSGEFRKICSKRMRVPLKNLNIKLVFKFLHIVYEIFECNLNRKT
jgi:hypothetical protein